jgi:uncharacterized phage protein (TIGR01671 family)
MKRINISKGERDRMREHMFRGQRIDTKEWVNGYLFGIWERKYILWGTTNDIPNMIEVIPETVGEYTGLHDRNGAEIYEGDILKRTYETKDGEKTSLYVAVYDLGCFYCQEEGKAFSSSVGYYTTLVNGNGLEVIGNIHDGEAGKGK